MCVSGCARCVGLTLVPLSLICMLANVLLLLPALDGHFLLEGHVTREATWSTGIWASGFLVLVGSRAFVSSSTTRGCCAFRTEMLCVVCYSCVCMAAAGLCCVVSGTGLVQGPLCLYNSSSTHTLTWGTPLSPTPDGNPGYLYNRALWSSVCVEPRAVVEWNVLLFGVTLLCSGLQTALCAVSLLNSLLGALVGPCCCNNKVSPA